MQAERARREGWQYGVKLVRGAYMVQERALALKQGERSPIHPNLSATHASFDAAVDFCLRMVTRGEGGWELGVWVGGGRGAMAGCTHVYSGVVGAGEVLVASHNENSIQVSFLANGNAHY